MAMQERMPGNAHQKRNCWQRGRGSYSMRGELRRGISLNKKYPESVKLIVFICQSTIRLAKSKKCTLIMLNQSA